MSLLTLNEQPGRTAYLNGKEFLFFSGYSYLAMQQVPEFVELVKEGIDKYGWLYPSSRISNTRLQLFEECEALLSSITAMEDTLLVSSGFLAGSLATELWKNELVNLVPSHPAIDRNYEATSQSSGKVYAVDSVNVLTAQVTDFSFLSQNKNQKIIIADDSHGIGIIGANGEGISSTINAFRNACPVISYSLSKAYNINAGAVSCSKNIADMLRRLPQYAAATAPSPAMLQAFVKGRHLYQFQLKKLKKNIAFFQSLVEHLSAVVYHAELPVIILPSAADEAKFLEKNIIISSFAYPDPSGKKCNRIVINAAHTFSDLEYLAASLKNILQQ